MSGSEQHGPPTNTAEQHVQSVLPAVRPHGQFPIVVREDEPGALKQILDAGVDIYKARRGALAAFGVIKLAGFSLSGVALAGYKIDAALNGSKAQFILEALSDPTALTMIVSTVVIALLVNAWVLTRVHRAAQDERKFKLALQALDNPHVDKAVKSEVVRTLCVGTTRRHRRLAFTHPR